MYWVLLGFLWVLSGFYRLLPSLLFFFYRIYMVEQSLSLPSFARFNEFLLKAEYGFYC